MPKVVSKRNRIQYSVLEGSKRASAAPRPACTPAVYKREKRIAQDATAIRKRLADSRALISIALETSAGMGISAKRSAAAENVGVLETERSTGISPVAGSRKRRARS